MNNTNNHYDSYDENDENNENDQNDETINPSYNQIIQDYIEYSREYLILSHNILALASRNDDRVYNLLYLMNIQQQQSIYRRSNPRPNTTSSNTPNTTSESVPNINNRPNLVRSNNVRSDAVRSNIVQQNTPMANRPSRPNSSNNNNNNNRRQQPVRYSNTSSPYTSVTQSNFQRNTPNLNNRPRRTYQPSPNNTRNVRPRGSYNNRNETQSTAFSTNDIFNQNNVMGTQFTELFLNAFENMNNPINLDPVVISASEEQINNACEDLSFNSIINPLNSSCPITLERFTNESRVTQILFCGHCYSPQALRTWFRSNVRCPICRYDIRNYNPMSIIRNPYSNIQRQEALSEPMELPNSSQNISLPLDISGQLANPIALLDSSNNSISLVDISYSIVFDR